MKEICFKLRIVGITLLVSHQLVWNIINVAALNCRKMQRDLIKNFV